MSIEKCRITLSLTLVVLGASLTLLAADESREVDPILQFYCDKARTTCADRSPVEHAVSYSLTTTTSVKKLGSRGEIAHIDSTAADFYYSGGTLDSQKTAVSTTGKFSHLNFSYPNVFDSDYRFNFFPNDTGGKYLAIGFDSDSANDPRPVGLAIIDRDEYYLHRLYLFYPHKEGFKRFSRTFHFVEHEGYLFPDSICEITAKAGIFSTDHYRLETVISNIKVYR